VLLSHARFTYLSRPFTNRYSDANEIFSRWTELTATGSYNVYSQMYDSYAYIGVWARMPASNYSFSQRWPYPGPFGNVNLCFSSPVVGLHKNVPNYSITGGTGYTCN
jgi:hypothetical protein